MLIKSVSTKIKRTGIPDVHSSYSVNIPVQVVAFQQTSTKLKTLVFHQSHSAIHNIIQN